jgi:hypothetical protein
MVPREDGRNQEYGIGSQGGAQACRWRGWPGCDARRSAAELEHLCYRAGVASFVLVCALAASSIVSSLSPPAAFAPEAEAQPEPEPPPEPAAGGSYEGALAAVDEANIAVNRDPEANLAALEQAIDALLAFGPQIAADPKGSEALDLSLLNLARALLLTGANDRATQVMDAVLLTAHDRKLPVKRFGPTLADFHDERRKALDGLGTGSILVNCRISCRVVLDEQTASSSSGSLYLGSHRVWVEAADGSAEPERHTIELSTPGVTEVVYYPAESDDECEIVASVPVVETPVAAPSPKRLLPRWAEIGVMVIGAGAVAAGGVLMGLDGKCPGGGDPMADAAQCPELYEGTISGLVSLGVGAGLLLTGTVMLSVDEVRIGKETGRQAMLTWRMRF